MFQSDGGDKHYGFYPSNGELRLSRFDGPDVYAWQVLQQIRSPHLKPDGWNTLKVRIEADRFRVLSQRRAGDRIQRQHLQNRQSRPVQIPPHGS